MKVSPNILFICFSGDKLSCITTSKSFSSFVIDVTFSPNVRVCVCVCVCNNNNDNNNNNNNNNQFIVEAVKD